EQQQQTRARRLTGRGDSVLPRCQMRTYNERTRRGRLTLGVSMGIMLGVQPVDGTNPIQLEQYLPVFPPLTGLGDDILQLDGTVAEFEVTTQRVSAWNREPYPRDSDNPGFNIVRWPHSKLLNPVYDQEGNFYGSHPLPTPMFHDV